MDAYQRQTENRNEKQIENYKQKIQELESRIKQLKSKEVENRELQMLKAHSEQTVKQLNVSVELIQ